MDQPSGPPEERPAGSVRDLGAALLALAGTRAELIGIEAREEGMRAARALLVGAVAVVLLGVALVFLGAVMVVAAGDEHRLAALVAVTVLYAAAGLGLLAWVRAAWRDAPTPFSATALEIEADVEGLRGGALKRP